MTIPLSDASNSAVGISALLVSLVCLGTWPALIRLCTWGHQQESSQNMQAYKLFAPQHRHVCHVYMDYALAYVFSSCLPIITSLFLRSQQQSYSFILIGIAVMGGTLLSFGNLAMQWSVSVFDAPLTTVLAIQASLTVVIGTSLNYLLEPSKTTRPRLLGNGVAAFLFAISLATCAQLWAHHPKHQNPYMECGDVQDSPTQQKGGLIALPTMETHGEDANKKIVGNAESSYGGDSNKNWTFPNRSDSLYSDDSSVVTTLNSARMGLCIAFAGGVCFGFFSPAFNISVNDPFAFSQGGLSVAFANIWFSLAFGMSSILGNVNLMSTRYSNNILPHSTFRIYLTQEPLGKRKVALLAGVICALGNLLQFQGGKLAGFATADLVQAFPLVATVWDVLLFGEFRHATIRVLVTVVGMYVAYLFGIALLAFSIDF